MYTVYSVPSTPGSRRCHDGPSEGPWNNAFWLCALYPAAMAAVVAAVNAVPRYRLPLLPFGCVLFAGGIQALLDGYRQRRPSRRRTCVAAAVALLVVGNMALIAALEMAKASDPRLLDQW